MASIRAAKRNQNRGLNPYVCEVLSLSSISLYQNNYDNYEVTNWLGKLNDSSIAWQPHREYMTPDHRSQVLKHFEADNRVIHEERFRHLDFERIFGLESFAKNYDEIEGIKMAVSLQFEILYTLLTAMKSNELKLQEEITRLTQSVFEREQQIEGLLSSKSWRLTKPLRSLWRRFV